MSQKLGLKIRCSDFTWNWYFEWRRQIWDLISRKIWGMKKNSWISVLRSHIVEISGFFYDSDFTWNQFWESVEDLKLPFMHTWARGGDIGGFSLPQDLDPPSYSPSQITASPTFWFLSWSPLVQNFWTP